jgi:hypothetical protein
MYDNLCNPFCLLFIAGIGYQLYYVYYNNNSDIVVKYITDTFGFLKILVLHGIVVLVAGSETGRPLSLLCWSKVECGGCGIVSDRTGTAGGAYK